MVFVDERCKYNLISIYNDHQSRNTYAEAGNLHGFPESANLQLLIRIVASLVRRRYLAQGGLYLFSFQTVESTLSDTELLQRVRDSDREAFRLLFHRYQPMLYRQSLFFTGHSDISHDIVQETFVRVWERRRLLKPHLSFPAFILRISRNLMLDNAKQRKTREKLEVYVPPPSLSEGDDPAEAFQLTTLEERINSIVKRDLPERCRQIFLLNRFEGKTYREIADMLHLSVRTVEHQISHALKVLREKLRDMADEGS